MSLLANSDGCNICITQPLLSCFGTSSKYVVVYVLPTRARLTTRELEIKDIDIFQTMKTRMQINPRDEKVAKLRNFKPDDCTGYQVVSKQTTAIATSSQYGKRFCF